MSVLKVQCPNPECHASFSIAPDDAARFRRCPQCGAELSVLGDPGSGGDSGVTVPKWPATQGPSGLAEGATFAGRYKILRILGRGAMGTVYLAQDAQLDRPVALKVPQLYGDDADFLRRFRREARSAARLHHPNICPVHDVGEHDGQPYLTMAYIDGTSMAEYLKRRDAPLDPAKAVRLVRTLALALQKAHEAGVIHRDLKPGNIMMSREGRPIVTDFGLARRDDAEDSLRTRTGQAMGTPAYMPLEQFRGDVQAMGPRSDIYSLGVILFQLLTGRLPYKGPAGSVLEQLLTTGPPSLSTLRPGLDPALESICLKAMAKAIPDRFDSMAEFATALDACLEGERQSPSPAPEPTPAPAQAPLRPPATPRRRLGLNAAAASVVLVLGAVIWVATDNGTIKIEVTDPIATVRVDGHLVTAKSLKEPITLRAGEHDLLVTRNDQLVETRNFQVKRGPNDPLRVDLKPLELAVAARPKPDHPPNPVKDTAKDGATIKQESGAPIPVSREPTKSASGPAEVKIPIPPQPSNSVFFAGTTAGESKSLRLDGIDLTFRWCPPGRFTMGSPPSEEKRSDNEDQVRVELPRGFWMLQTEVTQELYQALMDGRNPSEFKGPRNPVESVSWDDANECAARLTARLRATGALPGSWAMRLPTEAQWEYACRAGGTGSYGFGDDAAKLGEHAWDSENSQTSGVRQTHPVEQKKPNAWNLYDMHGNVWEWCFDDYQKQLPGGADPFVATGEASARVIRGGNWNYGATDCRAASRGRSAPTSRGLSLGFRLAAVASGG